MTATPTVGVYTKLQVDRLIALIPSSAVQRVAGRTGDVVLTKTDVGLDQVDNTSDMNKPISSAVASALGQRAPLIGGKIPNQYISNYVLNTRVVVANAAAMLALTADQVQPGDVAVRQDGAGTFMLTGDDPSNINNWGLLSAPTDAVTSVQGKAGAVILTAADLGIVDLGFAVLTDPQYAGGLKTNNTAAQNDAVIDAAIGSGKQVLVCPEGIYQFAAKHSFVNQDLVCAAAGAGLNGLGRGTQFKATAAAAQFEFSGGGGLTRDFYINGNGIATLPLRIIGGLGAAGRTFMGVTTRNSAQDGCYIEACQNYVFQQCTVTDAARDLLWLDGGTGGHSFIRCEFYNSGRYHLRSDNTVDYTQYGVYSSPSDITWDHCIFEGASGTSHIWINAGYEQNFRATRFFAQSPSTGPLVDIVNGANIAFDDPLFQLHNSSSATAYVPGSQGIRVRNYSIVSIGGAAIFSNFENCIVIDGVTCHIGLSSDTTFYYIGNRVVPTNGGNAFQAANFLAGGMSWDRQYNYEPIMASFNYLRTGLLWQCLPDGTMGWGPGSGSFNMDTFLKRRAAGILGNPNATGTFAIGGGTTAQRIAAYTAAQAGFGACWFNTDTGNIDVSDGTTWRTQYDHGWFNLSLGTNGSQASGYDTVGVTKLKSGLVCLRGALSSVTVGSTAMFTLPAGYRPLSSSSSNTKLIGVTGFNGTNSVASMMKVDNAGVCTLFFGAGLLLLLDGISFVAEA